MRDFGTKYTNKGNETKHMITNENKCIIKVVALLKRYLLPKKGEDLTARTKEFEVWVKF